jgi:hypothetical protein
MDVADAARNDPMGFYHGVSVRLGKEDWILSGPPGGVRCGQNAKGKPFEEQLTILTANSG